MGPESGMKRDPIWFRLLMGMKAVAGVAAALFFLWYFWTTLTHWNP